ncbi:MAG: hypothetical protein ABS52_16840 [Gemmatimonadetes bacterium SCN 70-22]|nr:MAG: hypothetical protein ABS52_16840 [Gemmatimonadetes bacterium SCN 70-22]
MPLSPHLRDRILRQLDTLSDDKGYAVLDYVDFIASRHGVKEASPASLFTRFTEGIEDTLRAGKVSASAISQTMGLLNQAVGVLSGVAAAGKSVASDIVTTASDVAKGVAGTAQAGGQPATRPGGDAAAAAPGDPAVHPASDAASAAGGASGARGASGAGDSEENPSPS